MFSNVAPRLKKHINIGDIYIGRPDDLAWTVLGSCVSIILYNPDKRIGAICHAQMPGNLAAPFVCHKNCPHPCLARPDNNKQVFVNCAIVVMLDKLRKMGFDSEKLKAQLYGGSSMYNIRQDGLSIGDMNVKVAQNALREAKVQIIKKDTGGDKGRRLLFDFVTGQSDVQII